VVVTANETRSAPVLRQLRVEEIRLPGTTGLGSGFPLPGHVLQRLDAIAGETTLRPRPRRFDLRVAGFEVAAPGVEAVTGASAVQARLVARGRTATVQHSADHLVEV
jgi:hypothetical protein